MSARSETPPAAAVGYLELVRRNRDFRRLWLGDVASHLGDWFNTIAVYTLIDRLTGSPLALGLVFLTKSLPFALAAPIAGLVADRFDRRRLMIGCDLVRALVVLGLLLVREPDDVVWIYVLGALQMLASAVFIPARSASIPNVTSERELLTANALSAGTWSALLALGAAVGGFATEWLGVRAVFVIDSLTYLVSAWLVWRTVIPQQTDAEPSREAGLAPLIGTARRQVVDGWRQLRHDPRIGRAALVKSAWALGGGGLVYMLALLGGQLTPAAPALGIGWLYAARGLGTGVGPVLLRRFLPARERWPGAIGWGIVVSGLGYWAVSGLSALPALLLLVVLAHSTSGANWVASTVLLQERTADRYRGRVFATEWLLLTLVDSLAILVASLVLERGLLTLRQGLFTFGTVQVLTGLLWLVTAARAERKGGDEGPDNPGSSEGQSHISM